MHEATLPGLVAGLAASRHAGGYRFKVQERVLRQFAGHCRREGYPRPGAGFPVTGFGVPGGTRADPETACSPRPPGRGGAGLAVS